VQDAFLGLTRARQAGTTITDPEAYLTTVVSRLGINYLRSARVRRETYVGDWLPEPVVVPAGSPGPAGRRAGQLAVHGVPGAAGGPLAGGAGGAGTAASRRRRSGSRWPGGSASCGCSPACSAGAGSSAPGSGWPGSTASRAPCCTTPKGRVVSVVRRSALWSTPASLVISDRCLMWRDCRPRRTPNSEPRSTVTQRTGIPSRTAGRRAFSLGSSPSLTVTHPPGLGRAVVGRLVGRTSAVSLCDVCFLHVCVWHLRR
jgi:hypothetical protein